VIGNHRHRNKDLDMLLEVSSRLSDGNGQEWVQTLRNVIIKTEVRRVPKRSRLLGWRKNRDAEIDDIELGEISL